MSKYYWKRDSSGNIITIIDGHQKPMHHLIFGDSAYIHKNGNNSDNRKENIINIRGYVNDGKVVLNGYMSVYMPEHERAFKSNGCVYEHILIAEEMLGRHLFKEECVHHIDRNRQNNDPSNLMVFATNSDHISYHAGAKAKRLENGTYVSEYILDDIAVQYVNQTIKMSNKESIRLRFKQKDICPVCRTNVKCKKNKMCLECRRKDNAKNIPPKEELEQYIWDIPFTKIGEMYGVSDKCISKWCKKYGLPYRKKDIKLIKNTKEQGESTNDKRSDFSTKEGQT